MAILLNLVKYYGSCVNLNVVKLLNFFTFVLMEKRRKGCDLFVAFDEKQLQNMLPQLSTYRQKVNTI